jgi:hypothetical protein
MCMHVILRRRIGWMGRGGIRGGGSKREVKETGSN